jgi:hypothetical protein
MSAAGDSAGVTHSIQKFLLIRARVFDRKFYLDINGSSIRNAVAPYVGLAVLADTNDAAVFCVELPHRVVYGVAAVFTEGCDNLVL